LVGMIFSPHLAGRVLLDLTSLDDPAATALAAIILEPSFNKPSLKREANGVLAGRVD